MTHHRTETLSQIVADTLRQAIWDGAYLCGDRLTELPIAYELNVSQNTVRDALRLLEQQGWVVRQPRRGVFVRAFTAEEAEEVFGLWALLESDALGSVFKRLTRVDLLAALRPNIETAQDQLKKGHWLAARNALLGFHQTIATLADRPQTQQWLNQLYNQVRLMEIEFEQQTQLPPHAQAQLISTYEHLMGIVKFAAPEAATQALRAHILENSKPIIRYLAMHR